VAAVDDPAVYGVYARENIDSEEEDEDAADDVDLTVENRRALEMDDDDEGYASDGSDIEDEDDDEDVFGVGDDYVSDEEENEEVARDASEYFGSDDDENVSDGRDIED
jgi:hypothetical protein